MATRPTRLQRPEKPLWKGLGAWTHLLQGPGRKQKVQWQGYNVGEVYWLVLAPQPDGQPSDLENVWWPAFSLGWKSTPPTLQGVIFFCPFFLPWWASPSPPPLPCCSLQLLPDRSHVLFWFPGFCSWDPGDTSDSLALVALGIWTGGPTKLCIFAYFQSCCLGGLASSLPESWGCLDSSIWDIHVPIEGKPSITRNHYK